MNPARSDGSTRLPLLVYVLAAGIFLMGTTEFMLAGVLPEVAADLGISVAKAGLLITAFAVGMIVGPPVMALATLRMPARATLVGALIVFAVGHAVAAVSESFAVLTVARVITALATGTFWAVGAVVATAAAGPTAGARALAVMSGGLSLAVVAGVPLGTFAGLLTGWRGPFWLLAGLSVVVAVAVQRLAPATNGDRSAELSVRSEVEAIRPWRVWASLAAIVLAQAGFLGTYSFISPLLTGRSGVPEALVPVVLAGLGIGALVGTAVGGRFGDRHPLAVIALATASSAAAMLTLAAAAGHTTIAVILVVLLGAFGLGANPVLIAQVLRHAGGGSTLASSLATAAFNMGTAGGSALAGAMLSTPLGLTGPAVLGALITGSALMPLTILAVAHRRAGHGRHFNRTPKSLPDRRFEYQR
ncbi:MFS transporter [Mycobacterium sp. NPDC050041]|uniref:MFS transporter n=1 Tax=Mycobacterium sp. NPDC050041 TaxID=3364293 RepID=UPI003C2AD8C5